MGNTRTNETTTPTTTTSLSAPTSDKIPELMQITAGTGNINDALVYEELLKNDYSDYSNSFHANNILKENQNQKTENAIDNHITSISERKISNKDTDISITLGKLEKQNEYLNLLKNDSPRTNKQRTTTHTTTTSFLTPRLTSIHEKEAINGKTETSVDKIEADEELNDNKAPSQNLSSEQSPELIKIDPGNENINDALVLEELLKNDYSDYSDSFHTTKMMKEHQNKNKKEKSNYNLNSFSRENQSKNKNDKDISKTMRKLENEEEFLHLLKNDLNHIATQKPDSITISDTKAGSGNEKNELHSHELVTDKSISNDNENSNKNRGTNETTTPTTTTSSSTPTPRLASTHGKDAIKGKTETSVDKNKADEELKSNNAPSQKLNLSSEH